MTGRLALFFAPDASSMAAHIAPHEMGAESETRPVSFRRDDNHTPEFLALDPQGKVPLLLADNRPMSVAAAICRAVRAAGAAAVISMALPREASV